MIRSTNDKDLPKVESTKVKPYNGWNYYILRLKIVKSTKRWNHKILKLPKVKLLRNKPNVEFSNCWCYWELKIRKVKTTKN